MATIKKDIGAYSAYAIAVKHGYEGTEAEWVAAQEKARVDSQEAATAAQAAQEAAEAARKQAQTAKTGAETAQAAAAQQAQTATGAAHTATQAVQAAKTAKEAAEQAQTGAQNAKTGAETARTEAQTAKTAAEEAAQEAKAAQTGAENAQKAAEESAGKVEGLQKDVKELKEDLVNYLGYQYISDNLIDVNSPDCEKGYYDSTTGNFTSENRGFTSNFIDFDIDSTYRYTFPTSWFAFGVTLWNENRELIVSKYSLLNFQKHENGVATFKLDKTIPSYTTLSEQAKYIRFGAYKQNADFSGMMAVKDIAYPNEFVPYGNEYRYAEKFKNQVEKQIETKINNVNPLDKKTILFTGDSICAGFIDNGDGTYGEQYGWAEIIKENNPSITMKNYGAGGTTIATLDTTTKSILQRLDTMHTEYPEADWIVLEGGVNDCYSSKIELGDVTQDYSSSLDVTTFCGALESLFKKSIEYWPGKKICFIVTFKVPTAVNFKSYMDKAKEICEKWSIPYIDLYSNSGLEFNVDYIKNNYSYGQGGLHPNIEGYKIITPKIEAWMKSL